MSSKDEHQLTGTYLLFTSITTLIFLVSQVVITAILARTLGPERFGLYSLAMRYITIIVPLLTLSLGFSLARYSGRKSEAGESYNYFYTGFMLYTLMVLIVWLLLLGNFPLIQQLLFAGQVSGSLILYSAFTLTAYGYYMIFYSYCSGNFGMSRANLLQLALAAVGPLLVLNLLRNFLTVELAILIIGSLYSVSIVMAVIHIIRKKRIVPRFEFKHKAKELLIYGAPKIPGDFALAGLLGLGQLIGVYYVDMAAVGYLAIGINVLKVIESGVAAYRRAILPDESYLSEERNLNKIRDIIEQNLTFVIYMGLFVAMQMFVWAEPVISIWFGEKFIPAAAVARIILISSVPYVAFVILSSIIDALEFKFINTANLFLGLLFGTASIMFFSSKFHTAEFVAAGAAVGFLITGLAAVAFLYWHYRFSFSLINIRFLVGANIVLALASTLGREFFTFNNALSLTFIFFYEFAIMLAYLKGLQRLNIEWAGRVIARIKFMR